MIKITKHGHLPEDDEFHGKCHRCKSEFQFNRSDAKLTFDQRDGDFLTIACPVCGHSVHVAASSGRPPQPPFRHQEQSA